MAWTTPKTNWIGSDPFMAADWLRIVNNVKYLSDELSLAYTPFTSVTDGATLVTASQRNAITDMIEKIYVALGASWNRGYVKPRVDYGSTWNSRDLNNIESFLLCAKSQLDEIISNTVEYYADDEIYCGDLISAGLL